MEKNANAMLTNKLYARQHSTGNNAIDGVSWNMITCIGGTHGKLDMYRYAPFPVSQTLGKLALLPPVNVRHVFAYLHCPPAELCIHMYMGAASGRKNHEKTPCIPDSM